MQGGSKSRGQAWFGAGASAVGGAPLAFLRNPKYARVVPIRQLANRHTRMPNVRAVTTARLR